MIIILKTARTTSKHIPQPNNKVLMCIERVDGIPLIIIITYEARCESEMACMCAGTIKTAESRSDERGVCV